MSLSLVHKHNEHLKNVSFFKEFKKYKQLDQKVHYQEIHALYQALKTNTVYSTDTY